MLLESIRPVVTSIRYMEEEDGVPLSYPYPVPAPAPAPGPASAPTSSSSPCLSLQQHADMRYENTPSTAVCTARTVLPSSPVACAEGARTLHVQSGLVSSVYGARVVQSTAAEAAMKWKAARLASSKKSLQVYKVTYECNTKYWTNFVETRM